MPYPSRPCQTNKAKPNVGDCPGEKINISGRSLIEYDNENSIDQRRTNSTKDGDRTMKAFFIHDSKKQHDWMVVPETDYMVPVNRDIMEAFISVQPDFSKYTGNRLNGLPPETMGKIIATRTSDGDVCIVENTIWRQRMAHHLGLSSE